MLVSLLGIKAASLDSASKAINVWRIAKATEIARCGLYRDYPRSACAIRHAAARKGQFLCARDVALEPVRHVTAEDTRTHLPLGTLAIKLHDKQLLHEAMKFLAVIRQKWANRADRPPIHGRWWSRAARAAAKRCLAGP